MIYGTSKLQELINNKENNMSILKNSIQGASIDLRIDNKAWIRKDTTPLILKDSDDDVLKDGCKKLN